jgi:hypothetical protein
MRCVNNPPTCLLQREPLASTRDRSTEDDKLYHSRGRVTCQAGSIVYDVTGASMRSDYSTMERCQMTTRNLIATPIKTEHSHVTIASRRLRLRQSVHHVCNCSPVRSSSTARATSTNLVLMGFISVPPRAYL